MGLGRLPLSLAFPTAQSPVQSFYVKLLHTTKTPLNIFITSTPFQLKRTPLESQATGRSIRRDSGIRGRRERATQSGRLMKLKVSEVLRPAAETGRELQRKQSPGTPPARAVSPGWH